MIHVRHLTGQVNQPVDEIRTNHCETWTTLSSSESSEETSGPWRAPYHEVCDRVSIRWAQVWHRGEEWRNHNQSLCPRCLTWSTVGWREECQPEIKELFSSSCAGPGQHPACGRGFQHEPVRLVLGLHHVVQHGVHQWAMGKNQFGYSTAAVQSCAVPCIIPWSALCSIEPVIVCQPSSTHLDTAVAGSELAVFVRWPTRAWRKPAVGAKRENSGWVFFHRTKFQIVCRKNRLVSGLTLATKSGWSMFCKMLHRMHLLNNNKHN